LEEFFSGLISFIVKYFLIDFLVQILNLPNLLLNVLNNIFIDEILILFLHFLKVAGFLFFYFLIHIFKICRNIILNTQLIILVVIQNFFFLAVIQKPHALSQRIGICVRLFQDVF